MINYFVLAAFLISPFLQAVQIMWADSLEFEATVKVKGTVGEESVTLNTGDKSMTLLFQESGRTKNEKYSVAAVHKKLARVLPKVDSTTGHNKVVAGITLFSKVGDSTVGYFEPFKEGRRILVFESGYPADKKGVADGTITHRYPEYTIVQVVKRLNLLIPEGVETAAFSSQKKKAYEYWNFWKKTQKEAATQVVENLSADQLGLETPDEAFLKFQEVFKNHKDVFSKKMGSLVDSEQYFLIWLSHLLSEEGGLLGSIKENFIDVYERFLAGEFEKLLKGKDYWGGLKPEKTFQTCTDEWENKKYLGAVIHLHSDREMCLSCAVSMALTFLSGEDAGVLNLKKMLAEENDENVTDDGPFVYCAVSCNRFISEEDVPASCEHYQPSEGDDRPFGIGTDMVTDIAIHGLGALMQNKILLQLKFPNWADKVAAAVAEEGDGGNDE